MTGASCALATTLQSIPTPPRPSPTRWLALGLSDAFSTSVPLFPGREGAPGRAPGTSIWLVMDGHRLFHTASTGALPARCPLGGAAGSPQDGREWLQKWCPSAVTWFSGSHHRSPGLDGYKLWTRPSSSLVHAARSSLRERARHQVTAQLQGAMRAKPRPHAGAAEELLTVALDRAGAWPS